MTVPYKNILKKEFPKSFFSPFFSPVKLNKSNSPNPDIKARNILSYEREIFYKMFSPEGLRLAQSYLDEEEDILKRVIRDKNKHHLENLIVIGAGPLRYLELTVRAKLDYIAIDKHLDLFIIDDLKKSLQSILHIEFLNKSFEKLKSNELPKHNSIYIFTFNIFSYLENPVQLINQLIKNENLIFISGWNKEESKSMDKYINYIYEESPFFIRDTSSFLNVHDMDFSQIEGIKNVEKITRRNSLISIITK